MKDKPRNNGEWTEARYNTFVKGALRSASIRWPPKFRVRKAAWIKRGVYKCAGYKKRAHQAPVTLKKNGKRVNNISVDHIIPIIDPKTGFVSWDSVIAKMFCEAEGLQVLCQACHKNKTKAEKELAKIGRQNHKRL